MLDIEEVGRRGCSLVKRSLSAWAVASCSLFCVSLCADEPGPEKDSNALAFIEPVILTRADSLPVENFEDATDPYLEGYIQALVDMHYFEYRVVVIVKITMCFWRTCLKTNWCRRVLSSLSEIFPA